MKYWLLKSDPEEFGWNDLKSLAGKKTTWDGVRNYQARNFLKEMKTGERAFFYHSSTKPQSIMGIISVIREAYPDPTQYERDHAQFDPKVTPDNPIWFMVDIRYEQDINPPITREELKNTGKLNEMLLFRNSRLSVVPVNPDQWQTIINLCKDNSRNI